MKSGSESVIPGRADRNPLCSSSLRSENCEGECDEGLDLEQNDANGPSHAQPGLEMSDKSAIRGPVSQAISQPRVG